MLDKLLATGDFTSESDVWRTSLLSLAKEYEIEGISQKKPKLEERLERIEDLLRELLGQFGAMREELAKGEEEKEEEGEEEKEKKEEK